jgi:hypothetical protein
MIAMNYKRTAGLQGARPEDFDSRAASATNGASETNQMVFYQPTWETCGLPKGMWRNGARRRVEAGDLVHSRAISGRSATDHLDPFSSQKNQPMAPLVGNALVSLMKGRGHVVPSQLVSPTCKWWGWLAARV